MPDPRLVLLGGLVAVTGPPGGVPDDRGQLFQALDATHSTASWGNEQSFWPRPRAMYRMLDERGYDVLAAVPWYLPTRTFWLCTPRAQSPA